MDDKHVFKYGLTWDPAILGLTLYRCTVIFLNYFQSNDTKNIFLQCFLILRFDLLTMVVDNLYIFAHCFLYVLTV